VSQLSEEIKSRYGLWRNVFKFGHKTNESNRNFIKVLYRIILFTQLRWIFRKCDVGVWTGWRWLRIGAGGGHL